MDETNATSSGNFIQDLIRQDVLNGKNGGRVHTRFPPEPNGYLHIGHARAIWINFSLAAEFGGKCNLRFDDTNPVKEEQEYIDGIIRDIRWLGYDWEDRLFYASSYFEQMYEHALKLIQYGKAYVDDLTAGQIKEYRGTLTEPGKPSPYGTALWKKTWTCSSACVRVNFWTAPGCSGRKSIWPPLISTCATR